MSVAVTFHSSGCLDVVRSDWWWAPWPAHLWEPPARSLKSCWPFTNTVNFTGINFSLLENVLPDHKSIPLTAQISPTPSSFTLIKHQIMIVADFYY